MCPADLRSGGGSVAFWQLFSDFQSLASAYLHRRYRYFYTFLPHSYGQRSFSEQQIPIAAQAELYYGSAPPQPRRGFRVCCRSNDTRKEPAAVTKFMALSQR